MTRLAFYALAVMLGAGVGFCVAILLAARGHGHLLDRLRMARDDRDAWRRRALTAETNQRTADQLAEVLPLTYAPSAAEQKRGLHVVHGGRR